MYGFLKKKWHIAAIVAIIVTAAVLARVISKLGILPMELGLLRTTLYLVLYIAWGISIRMRVVQPLARRYLTAVAVLTVFWFVVRTMKYLFVSDADTMRRLWYSYYIPILFIPLMALFVSLALGKPESFRLPKWAAIPAAITAAGTALVLTNDLHRLVFAFPEGEVWSDKNYEYTALYYIVFGWGLALALAAFVIMVYKCRVYKRKKFLPVVPIILAVIYAGVYSTGVEWLRIIAGDLTAVQCLLYTAIFESCIACGLIRTNTGYDSLFEACSLKMQIADRNNTVCFASSGAQALPPEIMSAKDNSPVNLDKNTLLKRSGINGGTVFWQEDITELTAVLEELEENRRQLTERNFLEQEKYNTKRRTISLREKNRLYDKLQQQTAPQIALLDKLFARYDSESGEENRRRILAMTAVVGAYIKRYGNLLFIGEKTAAVEFGELSRCISETFANLELLGVACGGDTELSETIATADALRAYSCFERVIEAAMSSLRCIWVKAKPAPSHIALVIEAECDDLSAISAFADGFSAEDGVCRFTLKLAKGGEQA